MKITGEIERAVAEYRSRRNRSPKYVVMDSESFLQCVAESYLVEEMIGPKIQGLNREAGMELTTVHIMGLIAIVIPTDGLPMLRVTGWPAAEAIDLTRETQSQ